MIKNFFYYIKKNEFRLPVCSVCKAVMWPPIYHCKKCFSTKITMKRIDREGKVIELTRSQINPISVYGLIELRKTKIRLVGCILGDQIKSGDRVFLHKCGYDYNSIYFEFL